MNKIKIGNKQVGNMNPKFIAEVSSNHNHDLDRCLKFIDVSAEIGCDAVKFQLFKLKKLFAPEIIARNKDIQKRKEWELPLDFLPALSKRCQEKNIQFSCTPFYLDAVKELLPYVDFYKISSYDLLRDDLLTACAQTKKPVVLSTGMATLDEVSHAMSLLNRYECKNITLLHCVSNYPTEPKDCNLAAIETLRTEIDNLVGWSDHTVSPSVIYRAVHKWNASMIEFHLDLDGKGEEYESGHCWLPEQMKEVIECVKNGFEADGNGEKAPSQTELHEREWRADPEDGLRPFKHMRGDYQVMG